MIMNTSTLVGTDKQKKWACSIIERLQEQHPGVMLPEVKDSSWWIKQRDNSIEDIISNSATGVKVATPFTRKFPMYGRSDAIAAIQALGTDFVVMDLETTGVKRSEDQIIEIAIVHFSGEVLLNTVVKPLGTLVTNDISKIEPEELFNAPSFTEIAPRVEIILNAYHACSYNAAFDFPFLQYAYIRYGLPVPNVNATCAMRLFSAFMDSDTPFSLEAACKMLHIDQESYGKPHRALADVLTTIELLKTLLKAPGDTNENISIQTNGPLRDMR
jgi:DNA polymerase III epsilon subunit-like protein